MSHEGQIAPHSTLIRNVLRQRFAELAEGKGPSTLAVNCNEFDDVRIAVQSKMGDETGAFLILSLAGPAEQLPAGADQVAAQAYPGYATVVSSVPGYQLSLEVNLGALPTDEANRTAVIEHLACLRSVVLGTTLRNYLAALAAGTCDEGAIASVPHRYGEEFYIKPQKDAVTVVFPMIFKDAKDATIAHTFLQQFVEARRQPALSSAPTCSYSKMPPLELSQNQVAVSEKAMSANGGFCSFVLFKRHVEKQKLETAVWSLLSFYAFISYHIKCSKAYWHSRMRTRTDSLLQVLNRAKPEVKKEKKTASGRTFVRK